MVEYGQADLMSRATAFGLAIVIGVNFLKNIPWLCAEFILKILPAHFPALKFIFSAFRSESQTTIQLSESGPNRRNQDQSINARTMTTDISWDETAAHCQSQGEITVTTEININISSDSVAD